MKIIGRVEIVMTTLLSLLLVAGCSNCAGVSLSTSTSLSSDGKALELRFSNGVTMKLVRIRAGRFWMGSHESETGRYSDEGSWHTPQREVMLTMPFYMGITEVTRAQWQAVMNTKPWQGLPCAKGGADTPACYISWNDAMAFCRTLSKETGCTVRLPTEAEWEYACRAGTTTAYSFGDDASTLGDHAWYHDNANSKKGENHAHPVGTKKPNAWGLYDMHGNVWEWCVDLYSDSYSYVPDRDPDGPVTRPWKQKYRVLRGGSWLDDPDRCRAANRLKDLPGYRFRINGFRVVVVSGSGTD